MLDETNLSIINSKNNFNDTNSNASYNSIENINYIVEENEN